MGIFSRSGDCWDENSSHHSSFSIDPNSLNLPLVLEHLVHLSFSSYITCHGNLTVATFWSISCSKFRMWLNPQKLNITFLQERSLGRLEILPSSLLNLQFMYIVHCYHRTKFCLYLGIARWGGGGGLNPCPNVFFAIRTIQPFKKCPRVPVWVRGRGLTNCYLGKFAQIEAEFRAVELPIYNEFLWLWKFIISEKLNSSGIWFQFQPIFGKKHFPLGVKSFICRTHQVPTLQPLFSFFSFSFSFFSFSFSSH